MLSDYCGRERRCLTLFGDEHLAYGGGVEGRGLVLGVGGQLRLFGFLKH
jgi:hypothetical protein